MNSAGSINRLSISISATAAEAGAAAAKKTASLINEAISNHGSVNIILATGASQFDLLKVLVKENIDWSKATMFHLDEYIGLPMSSPASFRRYLQDRFVSQVSKLKAIHFIDGENDPEAECIRLSEIIRKYPIHVALVGIGENGHLAFNDPPADFETKQPYIVVDLDERCRQQQMGEGWFKSIDEVPGKAISMSIHQICLSDNIVCTVPDKRKAEAVKNSLSGPVTNTVPASILQQHPRCSYFLDNASASLL